MSTVKTSDVRNRIIGDARKALTEAAGSNTTISKTEAKELPRDLAAAVDKARESSSRVTVDAAVDAYASHASRVLSLVDKSPKGTLAETEANAIRDPSLRRKVLDVRAELAGTPVGGGGGTGGATGGRPTTATAHAELTAAVQHLGLWHESGDMGVTSTASAHRGVTSLGKACQALTANPDTPWTSAERTIVLNPAKGRAAVDAFIDKATEKLSARSDGGTQDDIDAFAAAVRASCSAMSSVRFAHGDDLDGLYLLGKTRDGYVSICVQNYGEAADDPRTNLATVLNGAVLEGSDGARGTVKAFESSGTLTGALTPEAVLETLNPDWSELKRGLWGSADLDCNQPELGDVDNLAASAGCSLLDHNLEVTRAADGSIEHQAESQEALQAAIDMLRRDYGDPLVMQIGLKRPDGSVESSGDSALVVVVKTPDNRLTGFIAGAFEE